jgi:APA family basic amino acid/polyamine antiporter
MSNPPPSPHLERRLGLFPLTTIVISNMIGAGIFTTSGLLLGDLKNPALMLILWVVGGLIALCGALCYGRIGAAIPYAGGEYIFLSKLYHPLFGFLSGWLSFVVGFSAPIAAAAIGFSEYLIRAFPQIAAWGEAAGFLHPVVCKKILSLGVILLFTFIHLKGIERGTGIQKTLTFLEVILIMGLIGAGLLFGKGDFGHFSQGEPFALDMNGWKTMSLSLMWIMFAYSGWNASTYLGSEIKNPNRNLPLSLILGTGIVITLYCGLNLLYVFAIAPGNMKGVISIGGLAVENLFGPSLAAFFSLMISFALFTAISAFILLGPRVYYSMARDGYFFKTFCEVHPRSKIPHKAILLQGLFSIILVVSGTFDQILTYMGFSLGIFPILTVLGVFRIKSLSQETSSWLLYGAAALLYAAICTLMLLLAYFQRPIESSIALLTVAAGVPLFFLFQKKNGLIRKG